MAKKIKVHYYTVSAGENIAKLDDCLTHLETLSIADRTKILSQVEVKLEYISEKNGIWLLRFTKVREYNWPGVGKKNAASNDLLIERDSDLTENTFVVIDPIKQRLVIQYTQSGIRASKVRSFLSEIVNDQSAYEFFPILNDDALARYKAQTTYTQIDATIDNATQADIAYFNGSAIANTVRGSVAAGTHQIRLIFKVDARAKTNKLKKSFVNAIVKKIRGRGSEGDKLIVSGRDGLAPIEAIDLLEDVKTREYPEKAVAWTPGRRYDPDQMFSLLVRALNE